MEIAGRELGTSPRGYTGLIPELLAGWFACIGSNCMLNLQQVPGTEGGKPTNADYCS